MRVHVKPLRWRQLATLAVMAVAFFAILQPLGCGSSELADGVAPCTQNAECPDGYHCAIDLTCWHDNSDPPGDASVRDAGPPTCVGTKLCGSTCIDTALDRENCGGCGITCPSSEVCSVGACALTCGGGTTFCGTSCKETSTDATNCGACGHVCSAGLVCNGGTCQVSCPDNRVDCSGSCIDPLTNRTHCGATTGCGTGDAGGAAGVTCNSGNVCGNGKCLVSCPGTQVDCDGICVDPQSSPTHCGATAGCGSADAGGAAGTACTAGNVCGNGTCQVSCPGTQINCGGVCVDPQTSLNHCGATGACGNGGGTVGVACSPGNVCGNGTCQVSCPGTQINCGGVCIDPQTSRGNCGATGACGSGGGSAGSLCSSGNVCASGSCQVSCPGSQISCGGTCIDPQTNRGNCGATDGCGVAEGSAGAACASGNVCAAGTCKVSCPGSQINCGGTCIDPLTSRSNCGAAGACGNGGGSIGWACTSGNVCSAGSCQVSCPGTQINCNGTCVDPQTSRSNCGATGACGSGGGSVGSACANGTVCGTSTCQVSCPGGQINCGGTCIDPLTNRGNCGASGACGNGGGSAGSACLNGNVCASGTCQVSCPGGQINCGGTCVDPLTSRSNCGASGACGNGSGSVGAACANGNVCASGSCQVSCPGTQINCGGTCIDPLTSHGNCGASGACGNGGGTAGTTCASGNVCNAGSCLVSCPSGQINCDGTCVDPLTSSAHCGATGACGNGGGSVGASCGDGKICTSGSCAASCLAPLVACGTCVDPQHDPAHCSGCGACPGVANATNYCAAATCGIASCSAGFADCNGVVADGCEASLASDANNCGGCGNTCSGATPVCQSGTCTAPPITCSGTSEGNAIFLICPDSLVIRAITYASYGNPIGSCGSFANGACNATNSTTVIATACVGKNYCSVDATNSTFGDPCNGTRKRLYVQATCGAAPTNPVTAGLVASYDARVGASLALSGNAVIVWQDVSGNGNDLTFNNTPPAYVPTLINGAPGIDFGGGAGMTTSPFALTTSASVFFVAQWRNPGGSGSLAHHGNRDDDWSLEQSSGNPDPNNLHWQTNNDNGGDQLTLIPYSNYILAGRIGPTLGRDFSTFGPGGKQSTAAPPPNSISAGSKVLYVGKSDIGEASNAYMGQIVYYNRVLTDTERASVVTYLKSSWGIQ